jgi:hypothetical protein
LVFGTACSYGESVADQSGAFSGYFQLEVWRMRCVGLAEAGAGLPYGYVVLPDDATRVGPTTIAKTKGWEIWRRPYCGDGPARASPRTPPTLKD